MCLRQVEALSELQIVDLHGLYQHEWWSRGRSLDDVRRMVGNTSLIIGLVNEDEHLAAFARVLTDFVFHALIYDVIVAEPLRGHGLGRKLMDAVMGHPRLKDVSAIWLCCLPELTGFYQNWAFDCCDPRLKWMVKRQREGWTGPESQTTGHTTQE